MQKDGCRTTLPPGAVRAASGTNIETNLCFIVAGEEAAVGAPLGSGDKGLTAQSFDQNLLKSVAKSFRSLSPVSVNGPNWRFTEKIQLVFPLTEGLDNV